MQTGEAGFCVAAGRPKSGIPRLTGMVGLAPEASGNADSSLFFCWASKYNGGEKGLVGWC